VVTLDVLASDAALRRHFDVPSYDRGMAYARGDRVEHVDAAANVSGWVVQGAVRGSGVTVYQTVVSLRSEGHDLELYAACSCPVSRDCKHAVALVVAARDRQPPEPTESTPATWDHTLGSLLDELDAESTDARRDATPLGLQVELTRPRLADARRTRWFSGAEPARGRLRLRPVLRGRSGRWVRSGISWGDFGHTYHRLAVPDEHLAVAREFLIAQRATSGHLYGSVGPDIELAAFGPGLWRLLQRASEVGLPLVPAGALTGLHAATTHAVLRLDLAQANGPLSVRAGAELGGAWTDAEDVELLGDPAHGAILWSRTDDADDSWSVTLAPLDRPAPAALRRLLDDHAALDVPAEEGDDLLTSYVPRLRRHVAVGSRDGTVDVPEPAAPRLTLEVTWHSAGDVHLAWSWRYRVGETDRVYPLDREPAEHGLRDPRAETDVLTRLRLTDAQASVLATAADARLVPEQRLRGADAVELAEQVLPGLRESDQLDVIIDGEQPDFREAAGTPVVSFASVDHGSDPNRRTDWLDLEVVVTVDHRSVGLAALLEAITLDQDRVILPDGLWISLDHPELDRLARLVGEARELHDAPGDGIRVSRHQPGLWEELDELGVVDEQAARWVRAAAGLRDVAALPEVAHPSGLLATLRPYQHDGFRWLTLLWQTGLGGILADDMGLGKTVQTLALIAHARPSTSAPFLVVAPTSVVSTWATEARTFTPGLRVRTITESHARRRASLTDIAADADIVVTTYTLVRLEADAYAALPWAGLVVDEAQMVKNHQSKTHQAVRRLAQPFTLAVTGTPLENNLMELWALLSLTAPGLYPHPGRFAEQVARPIQNAGDVDALARLRSRVRPFMLRRTKEVVAADLPAKQEQVLEVTLGPRHRKIYDTHLQRERQQILGLVEDDVDKHRLAIFRSLTRLRRLSLDASLIDDAYAGVASAKIDVLVEHLREVAAEGHRALVFSQFTGFLERVHTRLDAEGIAYSYLDGRTRDRPRVIEAFKTGDDPAFLISLKAGGVGLTLTEADYCFLLDPWWNPAVESQAVDRTHRIGQRRRVMVYRLVATDTIEEKVMELKARKAELFASVVDGDGFGSAELTGDDIVELLG